MPIAVIMMVSEMTGTLALLAPSMVAVVVACFVTGPKFTIYKSQVLKRSESPAHVGEYNLPLLTRVYVVDAMNTSVTSLASTDDVRKAYQLMLDKGFRGIPIVDSGGLAGIVTMSDVAKVPRENMEASKIESIMTKHLSVAHPDESLFDALNKMTAQGIGRLPVVSRQTGQLVGIVTRTDVMRAYDRVLGSILRSEKTEQGSGTGA